jgi:hypothetical protein
MKVMLGAIVTKAKCDMNRMSRNPRRKFLEVGTCKCHQRAIIVDVKNLTYPTLACLKENKIFKFFIQ